MAYFGPSSGVPGYFEVFEEKPLFARTGPDLSVYITPDTFGRERKEVLRKGSKLL